MIKYNVVEEYLLNIECVLCIHFETNMCEKWIRSNLNILSRVLKIFLYIMFVGTHQNLKAQLLE